MTQADIHMVQLEKQELVKNLAAIIQTNACTLVDVSVVSLIKVEPDHQRHNLLVQKVIKSIDSLYPCDSMMHDHSNRGKRPSKKLSVAFCRALRRLINREFVPEVKNLRGNSRTRPLMHAWSRQGKGRKRRLQFDFKRKCFREAAVSNSMCCHKGYVKLWPAITLKKAIDQVPKLTKKVHLDTVELIPVQSQME